MYDAKIEAWLDEEGNNRMTHRGDAFAAIRDTAIGADPEFNWTKLAAYLTAPRVPKFATLLDMCKHGKRLCDCAECYHAESVEASIRADERTRVVDEVREWFGVEFPNVMRSIERGEGWCPM